MFLRQLRFLPPNHPALLRASYSACHLPHSAQALNPWRSVRGFPPWPPYPPHSHQPHQFFSNKTVHFQNIHPSNFTPRWHSFHTSTSLTMEHPDREPPHKRRKSSEEKMNERERHSGVEPGATQGETRREHQSQDTGTAKGKGSKDANRQGPQEDQMDRVSEAGPQRGYPPLPHSTAHPSYHCRPPAPPGFCPPIRQQDNMTPVRPLQRHWEASPALSSHRKPPGVSTVFDFSVMSYNILSQDLLHDNAYLYRHCNPDILPWDYRLPNLLAEIQNYNADILCLQEVQEDHFENQIKPALQALGYQCEYKKRTGRKPDGCAVIFKTSRLSLLSSNPVEFFRRGDSLLDRDNVGLVVLLKPNGATDQSGSSPFICVANTHLLYNPRRGDVKLAQLAILLAEISRLSCLPDGSTNPVVLCGDFNSTPGSPLYSFLTKGYLNYRGMPMGMVSGQESSPRGQRPLTVPIWSPSLGINQNCQYENQTTESSTSSPTGVEGAISNLTVEDLTAKAAAAVCNRARIQHILKLRSSYHHRLMPDGRPEITTCHSRTAMTVDYILYTPDIITSVSIPGGRGLQLLGRLSLVGHSELMEINGLPNQHHSSDHLPLLARFRLKR